MRPAFWLLLACAVAAGIYVWDHEPPPPPAPAVAAQKAATQRKECRDQCEQSAIVEQLGDDYVQRCRQRCDHPDASPSGEPPVHSGKITVAPAR